MVVDMRMSDILSNAEIDRLFRALADATRRDIVARTMDGDRSVSDLAGAYLMSFAAVQKHVAVLERAGLVSKERHGREQLVRAVPETIRRANALLARYEALWRERVLAIEEVLGEPGDRNPQPTATATREQEA